MNFFISSRILEVIHLFEYNCVAIILIFSYTMQNIFAVLIWIIKLSTPPDGALVKIDNYEEILGKKEKFCPMCNKLPIVRSRHCPLCNTCIRKYQYHSFLFF